MHGIEDMSIISTKLGDVGWPALASPAYLDRNGTPDHPAELATHNCLTHRSISPDNIWRFEGPEGAVSVKVSGSLTTNSVFALRAGAMRGVGITLLPTYYAEPDIASGALVEIFSRFQAPRRPIFVLYPHARYLPLKARLFIDFLRGYVRAHSW